MTTAGPLALSSTNANRVSTGGRPAAADRMDLPVY
jgi:hypothetical protein